MASIRKRGDNKYLITVSAGYDRDGKKIAKYKTVGIDPELTPKRAEKEAERLAVLFEEEVKSGSHLDANITFSKFTELWLEEHAKKRLERSTIDSYSAELNTKILPSLGHIKLTDLKPIHIIKFLDNLTEEGARLDGKPGSYSTRIIKYQHSIISSILQTAVYWQLLNTNATRNVRPPKGTPKNNNSNFFDEFQVQSFLEYVKASEPVHHQALALITTYGGLRKGEVLALTWGDLDFKNRTVSINKAVGRAGKEIYTKLPKNKSSIRVVTLPQAVFNVLGKFLSLDKGKLIFEFSYDFPSQWFKRVLRRYNENHEVKLPENVTFHGLRHTSATLLISQGLDIKTVSARLGHNDTTTTLNIYAHALQSKDKVASDALENIININ